MILRYADLRNSLKMTYGSRVVHKAPRKQMPVLQACLSPFRLNKSLGNLEIQDVRKKRLAMGLANRFRLP